MKQFIFATLFMIAFFIVLGIVCMYPILIAIGSVVIMLYVMGYTVHNQIQVYYYEYNKKD